MTIQQLFQYRNINKAQSFDCQIRTFFVFIAALFSSAMFGFANDSSAELGAGGLVLTRNDDIQMRSEDLYLSATEVRVNYIFFNKAERDVTIHVAFPMPDVTLSEEPLTIPTNAAENLLDFKTVVNGRAVVANVEQKAFVGDIEHTALLRSLGIPLAPHTGSAVEGLNKLPREKLSDLEKNKLIELQEMNEGDGWKTYPLPRWTLKTTWFWEQTFAANSELHVEHKYKPATGDSAVTFLGEPSVEAELWLEEYKQKYCIDRDFLNTIKRARAAVKFDYGAPFSEKRISYILKTGANWAGPIENFRLVVDKGDPKNIVSFCGKGVKKISPTQFEVRYQNYLPKKDLDVLILRPLNVK
jgi:hypothetical protein